MKKITIITSIIAFSFTLSVFGKAPVLKNRTDSLNYALGIANGDGIKMYYLTNDSTGKGATSLLKGIDEGMKGSVEYGELEGLGSNIGNALKAQKESGLMGVEGLSVNIDLIKQGLINGMRGYSEQMNGQDANMYIQSTMQAIEEKKNEDLYGENKKAGEAFLAENATKEGVVTTESGLQYKVVKAGKGAKPEASSRVKVHYHGTLIDGTVFDSSLERGTPATFGVNQVIRGWTEALQLMPVGSKYILYIPQDLAYGNANQGTIKPYSALIFEVELLGIE